MVWQHWQQQAPFYAQQLSGPGWGLGEHAVPWAARHPLSTSA